MKSPTMPPNRWFAWTKSRSRSTPTYDRPKLRHPARSPNGIANTSAVAPPMSFVLLSPRPASTSPSRHPPGRLKFAQVIANLAVSYPSARTIHLVMDNLNIHCQKSLTDYYGDMAGRYFWNRFTTHYTPKHGSWLNQAEIEISLFSRQCLGTRRIPNLASLRMEGRAWNRRMNRQRTKIRWQFSRKDARRNFGYGTHSFKRSQT